MQAEDEMSEGFFAFLKVGGCLIRDGEFDVCHFEYMERGGLLAALCYDLMFI